MNTIITSPEKSVSLSFPVRWRIAMYYDRYLTTWANGIYFSWFLFEIKAWPVSFHVLSFWNKNLASFVSGAATQKFSSRNSCLEIFCKKGVLKNFEKLKAKYLCQSLLFNKAGLRPAFLINRRLWYSCFPLNFAKLLRTLFL